MSTRNVRFAVFLSFFSWLHFSFRRRKFLLKIVYMRTEDDTRPNAAQFLGPRMFLFKPVLASGITARVIFLIERADFELLQIGRFNDFSLPTYTWERGGGSWAQT